MKIRSHSLSIINCISKGRNKEKHKFTLFYKIYLTSSDVRICPGDRKQRRGLGGHFSSGHQVNSKPVKSILNPLHVVYYSTD